MILPSVRLDSASVMDLTLMKGDINVNDAHRNDMDADRNDVEGRPQRRGRVTTTLWRVDRNDVEGRP